MERVHFIWNKTHTKSRSLSELNHQKSKQKKVKIK